MLCKAFLRSSLTACGFALVTHASTVNAQVETTRDYDAPASAASSARTPPATGILPVAHGRPTESYWYGWQTATSDAASIAVVFVGSGTRASVVTALGVGGIFFGAPAVHFANGRGAIGAASLALRVALPLFGGFIGYAAAGSCHEDSSSKSFLGNCFLHGYNEAAIGGLVGLGSAMVLDATALSFGTREIEPPPPPREAGIPRITSVAPAYDPLTRTAAIGMGGRF